ncbi:MAG TPA: FHA domain-containing protein [Ktedonosporobacter sp.]|jgi:pSer/pThr/pTyr-binding forkhead associated (FHA) protein|nr:FHA domain-containing protein [Ktedonosporobacter sp.]
MAQEQVSGAYLVIQQGPQTLAGKRVELWKDCTTIGRSRDSDIFLEDIAVHRKQASILRVGAGFILRDDHGSGDSLVNGRPVSEQLLNNGDKLHFGNTEMTFFANEGTRPFQLPSSRGRELYIGKTTDPQSSVIARLKLSSLRSNDVIRSIELMPEMTIGRSRSCNIFLEDLAVSRLHATIRELPGGAYELVDNRSATGTYVNGQAITRCLLREGDIVQIGSNKFTFTLARS